MDPDPRPRWLQKDKSKGVGGIDEVGGGGGALRTWTCSNVPTIRGGSPVVVDAAVTIDVLRMCTNRDSHPTTPKQHKKENECVSITTHSHATTPRRVGGVLFGAIAAKTTQAKQRVRSKFRAFDCPKSQRTQKRSPRKVPAPAHCGVYTEQRDQSDRVSCQYGC